jgi:DNA-binding NtrC family response regulator
MRRARAQAELAAGAAASVLVVGPPGSGRRHLAETIHYAADPAAAGALVPLECSLLPAEVIHSTFRGLLEGTAERAAISDQRSAPSPLVPRPSPLAPPPGRSTLLLIDADQLPAESQAVLAETIAAAGVPIRLIATAAQPLAEAVRRGRYRQDLAAELSTIQIELVPLAQRREDLPLVAQALLEEVNARGRKQLGGFTPEALDRLDAYAWPGNVAELVQVVAEGHARAAGPEITADDLPERLRLAAEAAARPRRKEETIALEEFLARIERELIRRALARAKGNKAKAARLLGLNRPRLYRRMFRLGILEDGPGDT